MKDSCTESYLELSQTTDMNLLRINQWFYRSIIFVKAPMQMLNYAQKTSLILYNTSQVKKNRIYRIYNYMIFLCELQVQLCKKSKYSKCSLKHFLDFLRKELYALVWIPVHTRTNSDKILKKYFAWAT